MVENLAKLRELSAHQNALVSLPPLSSLVLLETLNLSKNKLTEVPSLEPLSRLKSLDLRQNRLNIMPLLPSPSVLANLFLGHNRLHTLDQLDNLAPALTVLDVRCNQLEVVPSTIAALVHLKSLDVSNNNLAELPNGTIHVSTCESTFRSVIMVCARELDLRHNNLTAVPPGLSAFQALDTLLLSFNKITTLDGVQWTNMTKLTTLLVSNNLVSELRQAVASKRFQGFDAGLGIPSALGRAPHLNLLNIQGNPQRQIRSTLVLRGPQAVVQFLRELETPPFSTAASKRSVDNMDGLADVKSPPKKKSFQPVVATVVPQTPASPVRLESLNQQIRAAEEELDGFGVSNARAAALKKELANLRAQQQRMASDPS
ncbi:hypothetical protein DYB32_009782 [Aphanomyces invadans]|uniref:U2A'/phosphoprotein 32 family A C-terminal domain-containing protein n=1 Tax=Aphanomyces invadans TaxID=157072 RepID=A0A3R6V3P4_9STRA|nr:hypothetical protein DYB32_009782 [Aphanomyces invadans]